MQEAGLIGKDGKGIKITDAGLLAAAHKEGHGGVNKYLNYQKQNNWSSDFTKVKKPELRKLYEAVETRLRLFQNIRYR